MFKVFDFSFVFGPCSRVRFVRNMHVFSLILVNLFALPPPPPPSFRHRLYFGLPTCTGDTHRSRFYTVYFVYSYKEYASIPVEFFSQSLKVVFTNENVKYQLSSAQEKNILDRLASSTVIYF